MALLTISLGSTLSSASFAVISDIPTGIDEHDTFIFMRVGTERVIRTGSSIRWRFLRREQYTKMNLIGGNKNEGFLAGNKNFSHSVWNSLRKVNSKPKSGPFSSRGAAKANSEPTQGFGGCTIPSAYQSEPTQGFLSRFLSIRPYESTCQLMDRNSLIHGKTSEGR